MRTIEKTVFTFDELSDSAKENARQWWRDAENFDSYWHESVFDDAAERADILGIDLHQTRVNLAGGGYRYNPTIYFSGFSSQGDSACFEGSYTYQKGAVKAMSQYAPNDKELQRIATALQALQKHHFYSLTANCRHSGHYYHAYCMSVDVGYSRDDSRDISDAESELTELLRDFANWIYRQLEAEYEYQMSDEVVDENIRMNEYEFDENGKIN